MQFSHVNVFCASGGYRGARKETNENRKGEERNDRYRIKRRLVERLRFVFVFFVVCWFFSALHFLPGKMLLSIAVCFLLWAWTFRLNSVLSLFANLSENISLHSRLQVFACLRTTRRQFKKCIVAFVLYGLLNRIFIAVMNSLRWGCY